MSLTSRDIAGYQGREVNLYVKIPTATEPNETDVTATQIRGVQNFNPSAEEAETKVSELGYSAQKTIYGTISSSVSLTMLARDLVQMARLSGLNPDSSRRVVVNDFSPVNCICQVEDPDDTTQINYTVIVTGFKPRTANTTQAVEANVTITLDGAADAVIYADGKATVREHQGDGSCKMFQASSDVTAETDIYAVEYPAGEVLSLWDGHTYVADAGGGIDGVEFTTAPTDGYKVRIVFKEN